MERAIRGFSCPAEEGEWEDFGVVGEREEEDEGEEGVREEGTSCKETWFVSGGATSADPASANCAPTTNFRRPANGDGNVGCVALGTERAVSSLLAAPGVSTLIGTIANFRLSLFSICLCLYPAELPKESFFTFVPLGNGEGDVSFEAPAHRVLASSPVVSHKYG